jgi:hypothetical protein
MVSFAVPVTNDRKHTRSLLRNCMKRSLLTKPSNISSAIIPSHVSAGRTEYRCPQMNVARRTHGRPSGAHPSVR